MSKSQLIWIPVDGDVDPEKFKARYGVDVVISNVDAQTYVGIPQKDEALTKQVLIFDPPDPPKTVTDYASDIADIVAAGLKDKQPLIDALVNLVSVGQKR